MSTNECQPCENFTDPTDSRPEYNYHECFRCGGIVQWCQNCHKDHHQGGYQTCIAMDCPRKYPECMAKFETSLK